MILGNMRNLSNKTLMCEEELTANKYNSFITTLYLQNACKIALSKCPVCQAAGDAPATQL